MTNNKNQYFATLEAEDLGSEIEQRVDLFKTFRKARERRWLRNANYYNNIHKGEASGDLASAGEQGELVTMSVNHYRNIIQHLIVLITGNRPAFNARASNSDGKSLQQARLANNLLDYYMREKRLESVLKAAVEQSLIFDAGYVKVVWNPDDGREYGVDSTDPENPRVVYEGDLSFSNPAAYDIIFDPNKKCFADNDWLIVRDWRSRWDLAAQFTDKAEDIKKLPSRDENDYRDEFQRDRMSFGEHLESDDVEVFEFFHKKTPALPNGRYVLCTSDGTVLIDLPLPYREIPIYQITAGEDVQSQFGYTPANDLAQIQEFINHEYSTIASNHASFGVQNVAVARDANMTVSQIEGMNFIEFDGPMAPTGLNFTNTPPEIFEFVQMLEHQMETISGVNSVVRGNPEASLKSGTALALVQNMALQFATHLQDSFVRLVEDVGTASVRILRDFAQTKRVAMIAGKHNQSALREFNGDDLESINRVVVDMGNPLSRTTAGRAEIANNLITSGLIRTPEEYLTVIETGSLDPLVEHDGSELQLIRDENEDLMEGQPSAALVTDNHRLHILEHSTLLMNTEIRRNSAIVPIVLQHIQEHMVMLNDPINQQLHALLGNAQGQPPMGPMGAPAAIAPVQNEIEARPATLPKMGAVGDQGGRGNTNDNQPPMPF